MGQIPALLAANHEHKTNHWVSHKPEFASTYLLALHTLAHVRGANRTSFLGETVEHKWKEQE